MKVESMLYAGNNLEKARARGHHLFKSLLVGCNSFPKSSSGRIWGRNSAVVE